jgi:cytochrome c-type protein NapC
LSKLFKKGSFVLIAFGAVLLSLANFGLEATNSTAFCTSCHSMKTNLVELEKSTHYSNASGVHAECADCHVPKAFFPKMKAKILAVKDVYHEIIGTIDTPEKYEQHRWEMANRVWDKMKATDSRECRSCHSYARMTLIAQDEMASDRHKSAEKKGKTCIDCHKEITHKPPIEPDDEDTD